jgi:hypothetical protein
MLPGLYKPKYKPLPKIRVDVWANMKIKKLTKKKWKLLQIIGEINRKRAKFQLLKTHDYSLRQVARYPVYFRYKYQKDLFLRLRLRFMYGFIKHAQIKKIALRSKRKSSLGYIHNLEQTPTSFLYRAKFVITYGEAKMHNTRRRILVNGRSRRAVIKKGDLLHFNNNLERLFKRRWLKYYFNRTLKNEFDHSIFIIKRKHKIYLGIYNYVDFDLNNFSFFFLENLTNFKNHPFRIPFEKIMRWYTRV